MVTSSLDDRPAADRVERVLRDRIEQGLYSAGAWLPAERGLVDELGVSRRVVREAISRLVQSGHLARERGCRARVSAPAGPAAHAVVGAGQSTVAVVLPQQPAYVWAHAILRGVGQALQEGDSPYRLAVYDTHPSAAQAQMKEWDGSLELAALEHIERDGSAGVILWQADQNIALPVLKRLGERGTPVVFVDRCPPGWDCDYVGADNYAGMRAAIDHLLELGHRRIGYFTHATRITPVVERENGFRDALLARGIVPDPALFFYTSGRSVTDDARAAIRYYSKLSRPVTAVAVVSDKHAFAMIRECEAAGWSVPGRISITGFDDIEHYSPRAPILTTVHQPFEQIGQYAARLLIRRLSASGAGPSTYQHVVLPAPLMVRTTCGPAAL